MEEWKGEAVLLKALKCLVYLENLSICMTLNLNIIIYSIFKKAIA